VEKLGAMEGGGEERRKNSWGREGKLGQGWLSRLIFGQRGRWR
jgi:hypothetical protein